MKLDLSKVGRELPTYICCDLAELLGIMFGDGCLSHTQKARYIYISGHKQDDFHHYNTTIKNLFLNLFGKEVKVQVKKEKVPTNNIYIRFSDKEIFNFLKQYLPVGRKYETMRVPSQILEKTSLLYSFIRGLVDTDGCVIFSKQHKNYRYYPRIEITSKSKDFLNSLILRLRREGYYGSVSHKGKGSYRLELPGEKNLDKWMENIGFSNIKHRVKVENHRKKRPGSDLNSPMKS